jgi:DNA-binding NarL/FixJ family response regulator
MKQEYPIYIVIVEDDEIIRDGFVELLNSSDKFKCTGNYDSCEEAIKNLDRDAPDVILMDIELPGISGIEGIARIKKLKKEIDIITVSVHDDDDRVFKALCAGASGYLTKNITPEKLMDSIEEACKGGAPMSTNIARLVVHSFQRNIDSPLSPRETEVLQLLAKGKSYTMIADELFIDKETVRSHIKNIYIKLEVNSKSQAIEKATKERLI